MLTRSIFFIILFLSINVFSQENIYQDSILSTYYIYNKTDKEELIDSTLNFIKLNNVEIKEDSIKSKLLYLKGVSSLLLSRYETSKDYFNKALTLAEKTDDALLKARIYNDLGVNITIDKKDFAKAAELFEKAIIEYKKAKEIHLQIDTYYNIALNRRRIKNWSASNVYAFKYLDLVEQDKVRTRGLRRMYYYIADNYLKLEEYENAKHYLNVSENTPDSYNSLYTISLINEAYAKLYEAEKDYLSASQRYKEMVKNLKNFNAENQEHIQNFYVKELELENKLQAEKDKIISQQGHQIFWGILAITILLSLTILLFHLRGKNREKNAKIEQLNNDLQSLVADLKTKNSALSEKKVEVESLLELNEQTLFSRVLKISTYNDTIRKIHKEIEEYSESNASDATYLVTISKKLLNLIHEEDLWEDFKIQFEKTRPDFFNKLKGVAPNLSVNDLKHCTYIISNLKSKEVAQLINVSPRSVETARYRIKKKMGLEKDDNLYDYLSQL
ncbi:tetratricopeptide repeat protein [Tenacibaculum amylolyticum]|uniref:tetratricopeptide repeat protein n=1 Tax=Tenacibaculum amylolyticum TaxID=104269 RepID=UPI003892EDBF